MTHPLYPGLQEVAVFHLLLFLFTDFPMFEGWKQTLAKDDQRWISKALFKFKDGRPELDMLKVKSTIDYDGLPNSWGELCSPDIFTFHNISFSIPTTMISL